MTPTGSRTCGSRVRAFSAWRTPTDRAWRRNSTAGRWTSPATPRAACPRPPSTPSRTPRRTSRRPCRRHPAVQAAPTGRRLRTDGPGAGPGVGMLSDAQVPVVVHAGHAPVGTAHTGPDPFAALLARHPRLTAVVAHLGAPTTGPSWTWPRRTRGSVGHHNGLHGVLRPVHPLPRRRAAPATRAGPGRQGAARQRLPEHPYPYADQVTGLARLDLGDDWLRAVCWDSAAELFDLT
ncbi:amidohydrolase family protein [Micromonospora sp. M12]